MKISSVGRICTPTIALITSITGGRLYGVWSYSAGGFVRVMGNPGVLLFWIILAASFISHEWVEPTLRGKFACVAGVALGTGSWFVGLSYGISRGHGRISEKTLLRMEHISGLTLLIFGLAQGARIVVQLVKHKL